MFEILDTEVWLGIFILTGILYFIRYMQNRNRKRTVYRVSADSLQRSKQVLVAYLPLIEGGDTKSVIDKRRLPFPKEHVKSAAKILAYYYWKKKQPEELARVKNAYISLCRFQNSDMDLEDQAGEMTREHKLNSREFDQYMSHSPFNVKKKK
ncbi:hypothetical protein GM415_07925 [Pseudodesulfovibrio cashew]|uniref:Uncharacterized protein n=1 Tax=Pseudodesulfovibrio cashew TaxID=2678688 RepID=A0A6I6JIQ5_9BACT|nr:hypothetical protein [Pseudodesulfovibrio cashew]QGY40057.1 hypothetical protein GM415_07925 [Pseudodesulfovibrio cashew]